VYACACYIQTDYSFTSICMTLPACAFAQCCTLTWNIRVLHVKTCKQPDRAKETGNLLDAFKHQHLFLHKRMLRRRYGTLGRQDHGAVRSHDMLGRVGRLLARVQHLFRRSNPSAKHTTLKASIRQPMPLGFVLHNVQYPHVRQY